VTGKKPPGGAVCQGAFVHVGGREWGVLKGQVPMFVLCRWRKSGITPAEREEKENVRGGQTQTRRSMERGGEDFLKLAVLTVPS